jgi:16S rRNA processing protein RimM
MASVRIGRVGRPHGLRGHLLVDECSLTPAELQSLGEVTWRNKLGEERTLFIESAKPMVAKLIVQFRGVEHRDVARDLVLGELRVDSARLPDPGPGVAYAFQLVGLEVETADGRKLGAVESVISTGAHPVYVVQGEREWLIPANPEVVRSVDLVQRKITVVLPAGLEDI